ncbi:hypothetical protein HU200_034528 [Digitaria exilis]|uniref:Uncharacterized protein n=1 Tax=Digitaria exilis TaxID=1010633 RepID=A0A835EQD5_9POAL|nr:hypothetical protein HU200_034528 [Digitaria exilis]
MDPCTVNKCKIECIGKAKKQDYPYPVKQNCDTHKECCCRFYREEHSALPSHVAIAADDEEELLV